MTNNVKDIIIKLKQVREEKGLSFSDILVLMEKNNDYLSKTTLSRVFAEGSEESVFKYEETIRPIAKVLLDIETIEDDDDLDVQAMKSLLKYKIQRIEELEQQVEYKTQRIEELEQQVEKLECALNKEKIKYHEKLDKERKVFDERIDFLKEQISLKDKRMDLLLEAIFVKDNQHKELLEVILSCPARTKDASVTCE